MTSTRGSRLAVVAVILAMQAVGAAIGARPAYANSSYFVTSLADNLTPDGVCTLREAMFAANDTPANTDCGPGSAEPDHIFFFSPGTIVLGAPLPTITQSVQILGHGSGGNTLDGNGRVRPFVISSFGPFGLVDVTLERLTITNAKAPDGAVGQPRGEDGGAILNSARLFLTDVRITHSTAGDGAPGQAFADGGHGGAIYNAGGLVGYRVTFDNNSAGWGAPIGSGFSWAGGNGGAIYNAAGAAVILYAATFTRNAQGLDDGDGAAVFTLGPAVIRSSTFSQNGIPLKSGVAITADDLNGHGAVLLSSTVMADVFACRALKSTDRFVDGGYNILPGAVCGFNPGLGSIVSPTGSLLERELRNNGGYVPTFALLATSPARDRVLASFDDCAEGKLVSSGLPSALTDARGVPRPQNGNCDVGAFEIGLSFRRGVRTLAITGAGTGEGIVSGGGLECAIAGGATSGQCSREYDPGTVVDATPTAAAGSIFVGWEGDPECADGSVVMNGDKQCVAIFDLRGLSVRGSANGVGHAPPPKSHGRAAVTFTAAFAFAGAIDLGSATVTIHALLNEAGASGAGELVQGVPIVLQALPGGGSTAAIFETPSGVAPRVTVEVQTAPPSLSTVAIAIEGVTFPRFPALCATSRPAATTLTTRFTIDDGVNPPLTVTSRESWRCLAPLAGDRLRPQLLRTP